MNNVVKFPYGVSRRAFARKGRTSINGTPEERAASREMVVEEIDAGIDRLPDDRPAARSVSTTARNGHLREERKEAWRMAEAAVRYWRARVDFEDAVTSAQRMGLPEGRSHAPVDDDRMSKVKSWRAAIVRQLLTPAPDAASVKWKQAAWTRDNYLAVKGERVERAISEDLAFLAAYPIRQSNRRQR
jgi:DNA helicase IV